MFITKLCMFCGSLGGNEEHIVGKWILRDLKLNSMKSRIGFGFQLETGMMDEIQAPQPLGSFKTNVVCKSCNNTWMSQLENEVKPLLSPLLKDAWPSNDRLLFESLFLHSAVITRWLLKTACTFGEKMSVAVPEDIRKELFHERIHPEIMADLSCNTECGAYIAMSRSWNCNKGGKTEPMQCGDRSFRFVWQLRHLAMRVAYFPGCEKMMVWPRHPVKLYPRFKIPADYDDNGVPMRSYHYRTLEQLEHDTTYALLT